MRGVEQYYIIFGLVLAFIRCSSGTCHKEQMPRRIELRNDEDESCYWETTYSIPEGYILNFTIPNASVTDNFSMEINGQSYLVSKNLCFMILSRYQNCLTPENNCTAIESNTKVSFSFRSFNAGDIIILRKSSIECRFSGNRTTNATSEISNGTQGTPLNTPCKQNINCTFDVRGRAIVIPMTSSYEATSTSQNNEMEVVFGSVTIFWIFVTLVVFIVITVIVAAICLTRKSKNKFNVPNESSEIHCIENNYTLHTDHVYHTIGTKVNIQKHFRHTRTIPPHQQNNERSTGYENMDAQSQDLRPDINDITPNCILTDFTSTKPGRKRLDDYENSHPSTSHDNIATREVSIVEGEHRTDGPEEAYESMSLPTCRDDNGFHSAPLLIGSSKTTSFKPNFKPSQRITKESFRPLKHHNDTTPYLGASNSSINSTSDSVYEVMTRKNSNPYENVVKVQVDENGKKFAIVGFFNANKAASNDGGSNQANHSNFESTYLDMNSSRSCISQSHSEENLRSINYQYSDE